MDYSITAFFSAGVILVTIAIGGRWLLFRIIKKDKDD